MGVYDVNFKISLNMNLHSSKIGAIFFQTFTINSPYLSQYSHLLFIRTDLTDHLGSTWNISQNKLAPYAACMKKNIVYTLREKIYNFLLKHLPPQNIVSCLLFEISSQFFNWI